MTRLNEEIMNTKFGNFEGSENAIFAYILYVERFLNFSECIYKKIPGALLYYNKTKRKISMRSFCLFIVVVVVFMHILLS